MHHGKTIRGGGGRNGAVNPGDQLGLLSRKLEALQTRVVPLAIAASQHLRMQLQSAEQRGAEGARDGQVRSSMPASAMMTEGERATLLEEMEVLQRLLTLARPPPPPSTGRDGDEAGAGAGAGAGGARGTGSAAHYRNGAAYPVGGGDEAYSDRERRPMVHSPQRQQQHPLRYQQQQQSYGVLYDDDDGGARSQQISQQIPPAVFGGDAYAAGSGGEQSQRQTAAGARVADAAQAMMHHDESEFGQTLGAHADGVAAMRAEVPGTDPDLARLSGRWERGGLDPIEVAMLQAQSGAPLMVRGGGVFGERDVCILTSHSCAIFREHAPSRFFVMTSPLVL